MSIIRVGLAETKHFAEGYDAIFSKRKGTQVKKGSTTTKRSSAKKKRARGKK